MKSLLLFALVCTTACVSPRPLARPVEAAARGVYRLDFVLTSRDAADAARHTAFTLNLEEGDTGEVLVGRNVPLTTNATMPAPRQDVGLKIRARCMARGDDLLLEVLTEMSSLQSPSDIHKLVARGDALARPGRSSLVASLDDDGKRYELDVTPTRLR